ncbi:MAG: UvrD-helicase domain-containing protein, partial [Clostridium sp.]|nr:UvrD-helicase domain-containing protein [Clostridium sp.]
MSGSLDLAKLNEQQLRAVTCTEGPLLVLAGAGSGKTRVLTYRIAYLIEEKMVQPWSILALTFTNKAAGEMRERVASLVGGMASDMWVLTFHACCVRILRRDIDKLDYEKSFVIYDDSDQQTLLKHIIADLNLNEKVFTPRGLSSQFSEAKNHSVDPLAFLRESYAPQPVIDAFLLYQKRLRQNNALDFDDLLLKTLELFQKHPDVLERYQSRFQYILVDEYQDTNMAQYHIVKLLADAHRNLCVVGDDDQSIYGWRGADIRNILEFEKDFPGAEIVRLEQNYRSTEQILNAANLIIA